MTDTRQDKITALLAAVGAIEADKAGDERAVMLLLDTPGTPRVLVDMTMASLSWLAEYNGQTLTEFVHYLREQVLTGRYYSMNDVCEQFDTQKDLDWDIDPDDFTDDAIDPDDPLFKEFGQDDG